MKRLLALLMAGSLMVSSAYAAGEVGAGGSTPAASHSHSH